MDVRDLMHGPAVTIAPNATLVQAAHTMRQHNVGSLVVTDQHGRIAGILTDRDMVLRGFGQALSPETRVDVMMSVDIAFAYEHDDPFDVATMMATRGCRRIPVLDGDGRLAGVVSLDDMIIAFADQMEKMARAVRKEVGAVTTGR